MAVGQRVVVMPLISCQMRGVEPCAGCARGEPGVCTNTTEGSLSAGMLTGFCKDLPGGWSQEMVVHRSQVFPIPDEIPDAAAVLIEPFSVAIHAVLRDPPPDDAKVLIVGSGSIGLLVLAALRLLGKQCDITVLARHKQQIDLAEKFGATRVLKKSAGDAAREVVDAKRYRLIKGGTFVLRADSTGSLIASDRANPLTRACVLRDRRRTSSWSVARPRSRRSISVTCWARELQITGCYVYGTEHDLPDQPHSFDVAIGLLKDRPDFGLESMVTHTIALSQWKAGLTAVLDRKGSGAIKVVYDCQR